MKEYNGHRSYAAWNVSLWLGNDEGLYRCGIDAIKDEIKRAKKNKQEFSAHRATRALLRDLPERTPDGVKFGKLNVRLWIEENYDEMKKYEEFNDDAYFN